MPWSKDIVQMFPNRPVLHLLPGRPHSNRDDRKSCFKVVKKRSVVLYGDDGILGDRDGCFGAAAAAAIKKVIVMTLLLPLLFIIVLLAVSVAATRCSVDVARPRVDEHGYRMAGGGC
jgi:hypothetical protein